MPMLDRKLPWLDGLESALGMQQASETVQLQGGTVLERIHEITIPSTAPHVHRQHPAVTDPLNSSLEVLKRRRRTIDKTDAERQQNEEERKRKERELAEAETAEHQSNVDLRRELDEGIAEIQQQKAHLEEIEAALSTAEAQFDQERSEFSTSASRIKQQLEEQYRQLVTYREQLEQQQQALEECRQELIEKVQEARDDLSQEEQAQINRLQEAEEEMQQRIEEEQQRLQREKERLDQVQEDLDKKIEEARNERIAFDAEVRQTKQRLLERSEELQRGLDGLARKISELEEEKKKHQDQVEADKKSLEEMRSKNKSEAEKEAFTIKQAARDEAADITNRAVQKEKQADQLLEEAEGEARKIKDEAERIKSDAQSDRAKAAAELETLQNKVVSVRRSKNVLGDLTTRLENEGKELDRRQKEWQEVQPHIDRFVSATTALQKTLKSLVPQFQEAGISIDNGNIEVADAEAEDEPSIEQQTIEATKLAQEVTAYLLCFREVLEKKDKTIAEKDATIAELRATNAQKDTRISQLEARIEAERNSTYRRFVDNLSKIGDFISKNRTIFIFSTMFVGSMFALITSKFGCDADPASYRKNETEEKAPQHPPSNKNKQPVKATQQSMNTRLHVLTSSLQLSNAEPLFAESTTQRQNGRSLHRPPRSPNLSRFPHAQKSNL